MNIPTQSARPFRTPRPSTSSSRQKTSRSSSNEQTAERSPQKRLQTSLIWCPRNPLHPENGLPLAPNTRSVHQTLYSRSALTYKQTETQLRSLEENNIERLFPSSTDPSADPSADSKDESLSPRQDHAQLVIHVIRSILLNFLELVDILSQDPQVGADKIDDLQTLFFNAHHLLNEYRPHQARETLILMMEDHISSMRADIEELNTTETKVNDMLGGLGNMSDAADLDVDTDGARRKEDEKKRQEHARLVWSAMQSSES